MYLTEEIERYIEAHREEALQLLLELARIPAPSHHEEKRAKFCKAWLGSQGAQGVYVDEALNVVYPIGVTDDNKLTVYMAHSDVVFPDTEELPLRVEDGKIFCPGVGDDTANVVAMLMAAKYIAEQGLKPVDGGVLLVVNSCEEGLGNLKGSRCIMEKFGSRVREFVSFDGYVSRIVDRAVGSHRYRVEVDTEGGHSYGNFGNRNAIAYLASLIETLYQMKVPGPGTTYNVGTISGGTSVNTIAQHAEMLYEYRSNDRAALEIMRKHFETAVDFYRTKGIRVTVTQVGDRPCSGDVDGLRHQILKDRALSAIRNRYQMDATLIAGSTDCNIPLSLGIPAVSLSCVKGAGAHTREEYVEADSLLPGYYVAFEMILHHF